MKVGILAIQGDYSLHKNILDYLSVSNLYVKTKDELNQCRALIVPGGESTTISLLLDKFDLFDSIVTFSKEYSLFGTCAGSILMSKNSNGSRIKNINCIDLDTLRNSWGKQVDSFSDYVEFSSSINICKNKKIYSTFIRAPRFSNISKSCTILGKYKGEPVLVRNKKHLVSSFHPELDDSYCIYEYFLEMINE